MFNGPIFISETFCERETSIARIYMEPSRLPIRDKVKNP